MTIRPFAIGQYWYFPRKTKIETCNEFEVTINETIRLEKVDQFYFRPPYFAWDRIGKDAVTVVSFDEWAIARLLALVQEKNPQFGIDDICEVEGSQARVHLRVCEQDGQPAALLTLVGSHTSQVWEGFGVSYPMVKSILQELEAALASRPHELAIYQLAVTGRGVFGWDGRRFLGERLVRRPAHFLAEDKPKFRITEYPRVGDKTEEGILTEKWPPLLCWSEISNWNLTHKHCCDIDERRVRIARNQDYIGQGVDYTAGEALLPDDRIIPCILALSDDGDPTSLICLDNEAIWEVPCLQGAFFGAELSAEQRGRFPIRVISRLSRSKRNPSKTVRFIINDEGILSAWKA